LQTDKEAKAFLYVDAVLHFARCGKAIEVHTLISSLPTCSFLVVCEVVVDFSVLYISLAK